MYVAAKYPKLTGKKSLSFEVCFKKSQFWKVSVLKSLSFEVCFKKVQINNEDSWNDGRIKLMNNYSVVNATTAVEMLRSIKVEI